MMHYVCISPNCPRCNSPITGRIIEEQFNHTDKVKADYLRHGEYVKISCGESQNLFCLSCGFEWNGDISHNWLNRKELRERKELLQISSKDINEYDDNLVIATKNRKRKHFKLISKVFGLVFRKAYNSITSPIKDLQYLEDGFKPKEEDKEKECT